MPAHGELQDNRSPSRGSCSLSPVNVLHTPLARRRSRGEPDSLLPELTTEPLSLVTQAEQLEQNDDSPISPIRRSATRKRRRNLPPVTPAGRLNQNNASPISPVQGSTSRKRQRDSSPDDRQTKVRKIDIACGFCRSKRFDRYLLPLADFTMNFGQSGSLSVTGTGQNAETAKPTKRTVATRRMLSVEGLGRRRRARGPRNRNPARRGGRGTLLHLRGMMGQRLAHRPCLNTMRLIPAGS
ncbi:hypothetical protein BV22DRAFT_621177 [Leucogyrophana mollusca]|uniref:Uncharacterized protein n=1 Tax=Leucogyrophana mollusca TaxID=85980 RepID=A0ACB8BCR7_9AGAM|nr:hypothetical protein BV22DRAFT_621177 [Leucogyrophana mollusca]